MDNDIKDLRRRAGILTEQDETQAMVLQKDLGEVIDNELVFLGRLAQVLSRTLPPASRQLLGVIQNQRRTLRRFYQDKVTNVRQVEKQKNQMQAHKDADERKSGGPRRPGGQA